LESGLSMIANKSVVLLLVLSWTNRHVLFEPVEHYLPVLEVLAGFGCSNVPGAGGAQEFDGHVAHHFEGDIELFGLLDGAAQVAALMGLNGVYTIVPCALKGQRGCANA